MSTIRERDGEWEPSPIEGGGWRRETRIAEGDVPDLWSGTIADRRALLAAGDALAGAIGSYMGDLTLHLQPCPCWAHRAIAAWNEATG